MRLVNGFLGFGHELLGFSIRNLRLIVIIIRFRLISLRLSIKLLRLTNHLKITLKILNRNITSIQLYKPLFIPRICRLGHHRQCHIAHNSLIGITHHLIMKEYLQRIQKSQ